MLFLGGKEKTTLKEISEILGKETIDSFNQSENRGSQVSHGLTYQKLRDEQNGRKNCPQTRQMGIKRTWGISRAQKP